MNVLICCRPNLVKENFILNLQLHEQEKIFYNKIAKILLFKIIQIILN